jgi:hypothetical protein
MRTMRGWALLSIAFVRAGFWKTGRPTQVLHYDDSRPFVSG